LVWCHLGSSLYLGVAFFHVGEVPKEERFLLDFGVELIGGWKDLQLLFIGVQSRWPNIGCGP
jgi:hypothetical protein